MQNIQINWRASKLIWSPAPSQTAPHTAANLINLTDRTKRSNL